MHDDVGKIENYPPPLHQAFHVPSSGFHGTEPLNDRIGNGPVVGDVVSFANEEPVGHIGMPAQIDEGDSFSFSGIREFRRKRSELFAFDDFLSRGFNPFGIIRSDKNGDIVRFIAVAHEKDFIAFDAKGFGDLSGNGHIFLS
jgi:hypothetical protein